MSESKMDLSERLVLLVGSWRIRREGWEAAEQAHWFWDRIVRWLS